MSLHFVVWGTGNRGAALTSAIGTSRIIAYIDSDTSKQGALYGGKPVISLEQYIESYSEYFIIVTPTYSEKEILADLESNSIKSYFRLRQMPSEFQGYGTVDIDKYLKSILEPSEKYAVYGDSAYSLLVYDIANDICNGTTQICLGDDDTGPVHELIRDRISINEISKQELEEFGGRVLITERTIGFIPADRAICEDLFDLSDSISEYYNGEIKKFHNIHEGEDCFVVATGPSLRTDDLKALANNGLKSIGMNRIFNIDESVWTPDYYVMTDRIGIEENWESISQYGVPTKFLCDSVNYCEADVGDIVKMHVVAGDDYDELPKFSERLEQKVYAHATVTYVAIQIAVYMGFKTIYLTGVDCTYAKGSKNNYFFSDTKEDDKDHKVDKMIECYISAKKYADEHGINIYNATRGGALEVFERVDFDTLFI